MAAIIDSMPTSSPKATKYPWDEWFDGQARALKQGEDFQCSIETMRNMILNMSRKTYNIDVVCRVHKATKTVYLQANAREALQVGNHAEPKVRKR